MHWWQWGDIDDSIGDTLDADGGYDTEVMTRVRAAWKKVPRLFKR